MRHALISVVLGLAGVGALAQERTELVVLAAGSLRTALTEVAAAFEQAEPGARVKLSFGASGLLRERLAAGERADVFASANMEHPQSLAAVGKAAPVQRFARNALCALAPAQRGITPENLVDRLLDPAVRVGTSTPKADPSGDYAWLMFERIEQQRPGAFKTLSEKALQLTGGPNSPPPPAGRNVYAQLVADGQADLFITYCTNATAARAEQPALAVIAVPPSINVSADYGVATLLGAGPLAPKFVAFLTGPAGQALLARQGFETGASARIDGDVLRPLALDAATLRAFDAAAQSSYRVSREIDGKPQDTTVRGVRLRALLEHAGLKERDRLDWRKTVVIVSARDNYRVVFSWPELINTEGGNQVLLVYERDGQPLAEREGPLALVAPADIRQGPRHVKWLNRVEVRVLRE